MLKSLTEMLYAKHFPNGQSSNNKATTFGTNSLTSLSRPGDSFDPTRGKISVKELVKSSIEKSKQADGNTPYSLALENSASLHTVDLSIPITSSSSDASGRTKTYTLAELDALIGELNATDSRTLISVNSKLFAESQKLLKETITPFVVAPTLYTVQCFGDFTSINNSIEVGDFPYPVNYTCCKKLNIHLIPENHQSNEATLFGSVDLFSRIVSSKSSDSNMTPDFVVTLPNGTIVSKGSTPKEAWENVLGIVRIFDVNLYYFQEKRIKSLTSLFPK